MIAPSGAQVFVHLSSLSSEWNRGYLNMMAQLTRAGFDLAAIHVDGADNGNGAAWRAERDAIEAELAKRDAEADAEREADAAALASAQQHLEAIASLTPPLGELYNLIATEPGRPPREYADRLHLDPATVSGRGARLIALGLIQASGQTKGRRWHLAGADSDVIVADAHPAEAPPRAAVAAMTVAGKPSAGPVRVRQIEPADPVVRFKRAGQKAMRLKQELEEVIQSMVVQYEENERELGEARAKNKRFEDILGRAVDVIWAAQPEAVAALPRARVPCHGGGGGRGRRGVDPRRSPRHDRGYRSAAVRRAGSHVVLVLA